MSDLNMTNTQEAAVTLKIKNAAGNPAEVDERPEWHSSDETIVTCFVNPKDATGKTCIVRAAGLPGECDVLVNADADLGEGVKPLIGRLHCVITESPVATVIELTAGEPAEQGSSSGPPAGPEQGLPPHGATLPMGPSAQPRKR